MSDSSRKILSLFPLLALAPLCFAQQPPTAGGQLIQIQPAPVAPRIAPDIRIEPRPSTGGAGAGAGADQTQIRVDDLRVTGSTLFAESELLSLTGFVPGRDLTLSDLQGMAARITDRYRRAGYFVALAFVPAQDIRDHAVTIAVSEGRYGNVVLHNRAALADRVALEPLAGLDPGDVIAYQPLETRLLRLSDVPGVVVQSTLVPGVSPGTSDLIVDVAPGRLFDGSVDVDNAGNRYTGYDRIGATLNVDNASGLGDLASFRVLTSGPGLQYARVSDQLPVGPVEVGVAYDWLHYALRREFESLHAHGTAEVASVFVRDAVIRSSDSNLSVQLTVAGKSFRDEVDAFDSVTDKRSGELTASVYGDSRDDFGGGGWNAYGASVSLGRLDIRSAPARAVDDQTLRTGGGFGKIDCNASRLQRLGGPFSVYGAISGQIASKNLDISEKIELGGINAVRAYPEGEGFADEGVIATVEGRMDLPRFDPVPGRIQLVTFVDVGSIRPNKRYDGSGHRTLSGAGVGVNWAESASFSVRSYYAHRLGSEPAISSPDRSGRFWIEAVKFF